jgi:CheY-like chemotaxis protein
MGRKILADAGYDVVTVNNGSAALKRIAEIKPDLIVLDVYMPGYSGLEVCQRLKDAGETAHIPVLLTVGKLEPFKPEEARRVRADGHIVKPFEASELLTAITRLEDRMVPQQSDGGRFSTSVSGVERFGGDGSGWKTEGRTESDTGWKSRLRFPTKKKQEETEPEADDAAAGATFRDFRKAKGKTSANGIFAVKAPAPPGQEPGLVPNIPQDITPEELDALSALAEKLDGPIPAVENVAPLAADAGPVEALATKREQNQKEPEILAPVAEVEPVKAAVEAPASPVETPVLTAEEKSDIAITVEQTEPASEAGAVVSEPAAVTTEAVSSALLVQEPAPVDRNDEPAFASSAIAEERTEVEKIEEVKSSEAVAKSEADAPVEAVTASGLESKPVELEKVELKVEALPQQDLPTENLKEDLQEELQAEHAVEPASYASSVPEAAEAEESTPSAAQLAEALRLLTPAIKQADVSTIPSNGNQVAASGSLWVAESVTLSPEEESISLEDEMFGSLAAKSAANSSTESSGEVEAERVTVVSAIAAVVENRLAEAEEAASAKALAGQGHETPVEATEEENSAEVLAAVSDAASSLVAGIDLGNPGPEGIVADKFEAVEQDSPAKVVDGAPADTARGDEVEAANATASMTEENLDTSSELGGQESMGNEGKGKSGWRQIHTASPSAPAHRDMEEAKQHADPEVAESVKAMAAAAAEGAASGSATDVSEIASIVDTMLAELKPKLMQEIAKKLAKK